MVSADNFMDGLNYPLIVNTAASFEIALSSILYVAGDTSVSPLSSFSDTFPQQRWIERVGLAVLLDLHQPLESVFSFSRLPPLRSSSYEATGEKNDAADHQDFE
jgi:hypothetical protein